MNDFAWTILYCSLFLFVAMAIMDFVVLPRLGGM